ncbi:MAG: general secretion pathway protein GspB [Candidatus Rokubacteria bacterium]|nr:general secretion pathway protein GspB [Candidatus Rokubacteria bacterium]
MILEVLVYSERASERLVFISGQKYVEGQRVDGKFVLEAITEEGALLSHEGQRLLLSPRLNPYRPAGRAR